MAIKRKLLWLAITSLSVPATYTLAEDEFGFEDETSTSTGYFSNHVELGIGVTSDDNGKFGEFGDELDDQGAFGVGSLRLSGGAEDGSYNVYLEADKNPYSSNAQLGYRRPGSFSIDLYGFDSQKIEMFNALTLYPNTGDSTSLPLLSGFAVNDDSDNLDFYGRRTLSVERKTYGVTVKKFLGPNWSTTIDFQRQDKDGAKTAAGSAGFAGTAIVISPVNYQHDEINFGIEYHNDRLTAGASYYLSEFDNNNSSLSYDYPNFRSPGDLVGAENALAPSNEFERFEIDGSYRIGDRTLLSWLANWSSAEQDESFLPYSLYPNSVYWADDDGNGTIFASLPAGNLDGEVKRFNGRITLTSRPTRNFNYKLEYAVRDREADHDPYLLDEVHYNGDITSLGAPSHIYDKDRDVWKAEGGYRLPNRSKLRFGWKREEIDRTRKEYEHENPALELETGTDETEEDSYWASYRFAPIGNLNLNLKAEHAERDGDISEERQEHLHIATFVDPDTGLDLATEGENTLPFFLADRDTDRFSIQADLPLGNKVVLSGGYTLTEEDYDNDFGFDGLLSRDMDTLNLELSINPGENLAIVLYGLRQTFEWEQDGTQTGGSGDVSDLWIAEGEDETWVYGLNLDWTCRSDTIRISADLSISETDSELTSKGTGDPTAFPDEAYIDGLPNYGTDVLRLDINASWQYSKQTTFKLRYLFEDWDNQDFAWKDGILLEDEDGSGGIAYGWDTPDERTHAVVLSVRRNF